MLQCTQHTVVVDRGGDIVSRPFGRVDGVAQRHADTRMAPSPNAIERLRSMP